MRIWQLHHARMMCQMEHDITDSEVAKITMQSVLKDLDAAIYELEGYHAGKSDAPTTPVGIRAD